LLSLSFLIMLRRQMIPNGYRVLMISSLTVVSVILVNILIFTGLGWQIVINPSISYAGKMIANATMISSLSIAALLSLSFLIMLRRQMIPNGYRVLMISSLTVVSVILVNILIFTGLGSQIVINPSISYAGKMIANATMISSLSIAALLSLSFLIMLRRQMIPNGYRV